MPIQWEKLAKLVKLLTGLHKVWPEPPQDPRPWLIVDDEPDESKLYSYVFENIGVKTETAIGPAHARGIMLHQKFAGVVVDFSFPGEMGGLEFAQELKSKLQPGVFVLYLTGNPKQLEELQKRGETYIGRMKSGEAHVLIAKTLNPLELRPAFQACVQMAKGLNGEVKPHEVYKMNLFLIGLSMWIGSKFPALIELLQPFLK